MATNDPDAARLAAQHEEDKRAAERTSLERMATLRDEAAAAAHAAGVREGQAIAHTGDQDRQIAETIATLNKFMESSLRWQENMVEHGRKIATAADERMTAIEKKLDEFLTGVDTLAKAAGESSIRNLNNWQKFGYASGFLLALVGAILLAVSVLHGLGTPGK